MTRGKEGHSWMGERGQGVGLEKEKEVVARRADESSVRQFLIIYVLRPMAKAFGIRGSKIMRFTERTCIPPGLC